jgi:hypothetical protein
LEISPWRKPTFWLVFSLLSFDFTFDKIEAHFFGKFFHVTFKNLYFEFGVKIWKKHFQRSFYLFCASFCWNLSRFPSFLLSLLSKKSKLIFFRKFFHVTLKNSYFLFVVEIWQKRLYKVSVCLELAFAKIWVNFEI